MSRSLPARARRGAGRRCAERSDPEGAVGAVLAPQPGARPGLYNRLVTEPTPNERRWIEQWRSAGPALAEVRRRELAGLSNEAALAATHALLDLAARLPLDPRRLATSGLVTQQELLHRRR